MDRFRSYVGRHWQALLVVAFLTWRTWRGEFRSQPAMWVAVGFVVVGMLMNLVVMLLNRGMPVRATPEEISEEERADYHPISRSTRLAILSDWIPLGSLMMSPGDIVLFAGVAILLFDLFIGF